MMSPPVTRLKSPTLEWAGVEPPRYLACVVSHAARILMTARPLRVLSGLTADRWRNRGRRCLRLSEREPQNMPGARPVLRVHFQSTAKLACHRRQQLRPHSHLSLITCAGSATVILDDQNCLAILDVEDNLDEAT